MKVKRLEKLATFLETEFVGRTYKHEIRGLKKKRVFDFSDYVIGANGASCGTAGCAIGYMPMIWPKVFKFVPTVYSIRLKYNSTKSTVDDTAPWFGLDEYEYEHLFYPNEQEPGRYGGKILGENTTPKQVAKNIRAFIKTKS